jgi:hypothetical protein
MDSEFANAIESAGPMIVPQQRELLAYRNARSASGLSTLVIDTALVNTYSEVPTSVSGLLKEDDTIVEGL